MQSYSRCFKISYSSSKPGHSLFPQTDGNLAETVQPGFDILDNLCRQIFSIGEIVEIGKGFILQTEDVEAGFVSSDDLFIVVVAPSAILVCFGIPGLFSVIAIVRDEKANKLLHATIRRIVQSVDISRPLYSGF
ncbi:MAG: hypothetical protein C1942_01385 [Prosthecochloris sp.]|uniref:hypothetical protein n=1 Tax=Prosthecochloris sp. TaxID=290513 RepID=UPI0013CA3000|nr:hypothetical protein [Prosthecochloris sp.]NEX11349.1 hypothetical protein [Prosthecochloris sp.]